MTNYVTEKYGFVRVVFFMTQATLMQTLNIPMPPVFHITDQLAGIIPGYKSDAPPPPRPLRATWASVSTAETQVMVTNKRNPAVRNFVTRGAN